MITGCALRLVRTNEKLTVLKKCDTYFFDEQDIHGEKLRNINISFSPNGRFLIVSSTVREHLFIYEIHDNDISRIIDDIRNNNHVAKIEHPIEELTDD